VVEVARQGDSGSNGHEFVIDLASESLGAEATATSAPRARQPDRQCDQVSPGGGKVTVAGQKRLGVVELRVVTRRRYPEEEQERIFRSLPGLVFGAERRHGTGPVYLAWSGGGDGWTLGSTRSKRGIELRARAVSSARRNRGWLPSGEA